MISEEGGAGSTFRGTMTEKGFEVRGVEVYRSTYLPFMRGRIHGRPDGSELELLLRPHRQVFVFLAIWFTFLLLVSVLIVYSSLHAGSSRLLLLAAPVLLVLLSWMLAARVFRTDCRWVTKVLEESLKNAERTAGPPPAAAGAALPRDEGGGRTRRGGKGA